MNIEQLINGALIAGAICLLMVILTDAFETVILPRGVSRGTGLTRGFYRYMWRTWKRLAKLVPKRRREGFLSGFGPMSLPMLLALWAFVLIIAFAILQHAVNRIIDGSGRDFLDELYMSGTTFFTLGLGDVRPEYGWSRLLVVIEAGVGFGFLALVISYLPVLYSSFSRRETHIGLLDARASSPPTAGELLRRYGLAGAIPELPPLFAAWELWSSELMESHLSYPVLTYYRSQHDRQSWLAAITCILDTCALVRVGLDGVPQHQALLTYAIARHAVVDLCLVLETPPLPLPVDRLGAQEMASLRQILESAGLPLRAGGDAEDELNAIRRQYEPYVYALSRHIGSPLPPFYKVEALTDDWEQTAWESDHHL